MLESDVGGVSALVRGRWAWSLVMELMPWRARDAAEAPKPATAPLRVEIPMSERKMNEWMARLPIGAVVRVSVQAPLAAPKKKNPIWCVRGRLPVERTPGSAALLAEALERQGPVVIRDEVLGKLTLERKYDWFEGRFTFEGRKCSLSIERASAKDDDERDRRTIASARAPLAKIVRARAAIRRAIVSKMLPLYNDNWRGDRPRLAAARFQARVRLASVVVSPNGRVTLYFEDGGLFYDHTIEVRLRKTGSIAVVCLSG